MLAAIRDFFEKHIEAPEQAGARHTIELATAALLLEVVRLDRGVAEAARAVVLRAVREKFGLSDAEAATLVALAEQEAAQATDYYQFTSLVNARFSQAQKERIVELMWRVAYADAELSAYEQHTIRKLAGLLHVPPSAYIAAKLRARDAGSG
ncbi:MAG: TerB family tellurite resistance protein [Burkholderiales bacterium]|nr:TerB family tellurite resistance protein [Burkholderiales bacterium]